MDLVTKGLLFGAALIIFATIWNTLMAPKKKVPTRFFEHFMRHYGFTTNDQAEVYNGFYEGRSVQLRARPPGALIQVANPRGVHLLIEKGRSTPLEDLPLADIHGLGQATVRCNYPLLLEEVFDPELLKSLDEAKEYSFELKEGLMLRTPRMRDPLEFEPLLRLGVRLAAAIERLNYLERRR